MANQTRETRRVIVSEGDGQPVLRTARRCEAVTAVYLAPRTSLQAVDDHPGIRLTVRPDGTWQVHVLQGWAAGGNATLAAAGSLSGLATHAPGPTAGAAVVDGAPVTVGR